MQTCGVCWGSLRYFVIVSPDQTIRQTVVLPLELRSSSYLTLEVFVNGVRVNCEYISECSWLTLCNDAQAWP